MGGGFFVGHKLQTKNDWLIDSTLYGLFKLEESRWLLMSALLKKDALRKGGGLIIPADALRFNPKLKVMFLKKPQKTSLRPSSWF